MKTNYRKKYYLIKKLEQNFEEDDRRGRPINQIRQNILFISKGGYLKRKKYWVAPWFAPHGGGEIIQE